MLKVANFAIPSKVTNLHTAIVTDGCTELTHGCLPFHRSRRVIHAQRERHVARTANRAPDVAQVRALAATRQSAGAVQCDAIMQPGLGGALQNSPFGPK